MADADPFGMANGFSVSFLGGDVFMAEVGRLSCQMQLKEKAEGMKHHHGVLWPRLLLEHRQRTERRY